MADGAGKVDVAVQALQNGGARVLTVLRDEQAPTALSYPLELPAGASIRPASDGGALIVVKEADLPAAPLVDKPGEPAFDYDAPAAPYEPPPALEGEDAEQVESEDQGAGAPPALAGDEVALMRVGAPWAVDAAGRSLPTTYSITNSTITQVVDTSGAVFPVVADPVWIPIIIALTVRAATMAAPAVARAFAVQAIRAGAARTIQGGFTTFTRFKNHYGNRPNFQWHHIVEQTYGIKTRGWDARSIHHPNNLVQIPTNIHQKCINSMMGSKNVAIPGHIVSGPYNTLRQAINSSNHSFEKIHELGVALLRYCGVKI